MRDLHPGPFPVARLTAVLGAAFAVLASITLAAWDVYEPIPDSVLASSIGATDQPFRILKVSGPLLVDPTGLPSAEPKRSHALRLDLDPARAGDSGVTDIRIETDHPAQAEVALSVLIIPAGRDVE